MPGLTLEALRAHMNAMAARQTKSKPVTTAPRQQAPKPARAPTAAEVPVTRAMLIEVRTELLERIDQVKSELKSEIHGLRGEIHGLRADVARIALLVEEQNARNKVVLDGLMAFIDRQARVEQRMDAVEGTVRSLAAAGPLG